MKVNITIEELIEDLNTPVSLLLKLREAYGQVVLLESSAYHSKRDSKSYICFNSLSSLRIERGKLITDSQDKEVFDISTEIQEFIKSITIIGISEESAIVGYSGYNSVAYFESVKLDEDKRANNIPDLRYDFYRNMIVFDHFHDSIRIIDHTPDQEQDNIEEIKKNHQGRFDEAR